MGMDPHTVDIDGWMQIFQLHGFNILRYFAVERVGQKRGHSVG